MKLTDQNYKPVKIEVNDNVINENTNFISKIKNIFNSSSNLKILFFNIYEKFIDKIKCIKSYNKYFHDILCFIYFQYQ